MVREINWSKKALKDQDAILEYWKKRNRSDTYSIKLNKIFLSHIELLAVNADLGIHVDTLDVRSIVVRDYQIYYRVKPIIIEIVTIWDTRRNPKKFKL